MAITKEKLARAVNAGAPCAYHPTLVCCSSSAWRRVPWVLGHALVTKSPPKPQATQAIQATPPVVREQAEPGLGAARLAPPAQPRRRVVPLRARRRAVRAVQPRPTLVRLPWLAVGTPARPARATSARS